MQAALRYIRERFHPLFQARRSRVGRCLIRAADRPIWLTIPGIDFKVRGNLLTHGSAFAACGSQEAAPESLVLSCARMLPLRSFWDIGANIGFYSWLLLSAKPGLDVTMLEPLPANCALIRQTIQRNALSTTRLLEAAASDHTGYADLNADTVGGFTSTLSDGPTFGERHMDAKSKRIRVRLVSVDDASAGLAVDFIKMDIEGYEAAALRGAQATIAAQQPVLLVECGHPKHDCLRVLEQQNYAILDADHLSRKHEDSASNFLCVPPKFLDCIDDLLTAARAQLSRTRES